MRRLDLTFRSFAWYRKLRGGHWVPLGYAPIWFRQA
jgi:hypothetical protein